MCGIVAVLGRRSERQPPQPTDIEAVLAKVSAGLQTVTHSDVASVQLSELEATAVELHHLDSVLRGTPGITCLLSHPAIARTLKREVGLLQERVSSVETMLDAGRIALEPEQLEVFNGALTAARDAMWTLGHDRLDAADSVSGLYRALQLPSTGSAVPSPAALSVLWAVTVALRSLDRLEVRGRDSAGLHLMVAAHGLDLNAPQVRTLLDARADDPLFTSFAVRAVDGCLNFVYKTAAEVGELGDNVAVLRRAIGGDRLLALALSAPEVRATVVGHTRWASMGLISQANTHPLDSYELGRADGPFVIAALNGDVDNYAQLCHTEGLRLPSEITTDAKLIPALVSRYLASGDDMLEAFRRAANRFEGSVGVATNSSCSPDDLYVALRGSGQGLNIGLAEDAFIVASEAYGLVEETDRYVRLDGESGGQIVVLSRAGAGSLAGLRRWQYDGTPVPLADRDLRTAEITTRDIDRGEFRHFLLKEISEAPLSVRKTLRGKVTEGEDGRLAVRLGQDNIPGAVRGALAGNRIHEIMVIGQGTAAIAGRAVAAAVARALPLIAVKAMPATELSGWGSQGLGLPDDMSESLVIAISQSGTTTDTNRTVDLVRSRGAHVLAIVNRRNSDLVHKAHGVLYTSDGRDVEMSVASTKAFYSQIAAGHLLALGLAAAAGNTGRDQTDRANEILIALRELPSLMEKVLAQRPEIARVASTVAPPRRNWAVVGSGPDSVAAAEIRIKLSELCYKAIAVDQTEDKKHIDLSSEPMVLVCAGSASGANARDIAKEVGIFRAHKAAPVLIVADDEPGHSGPGLDILRVPAGHPELAFVLTAMAGHIFGYEAALAIDAQARPLREVRAALESVTSAANGDIATDLLAAALHDIAVPVLTGLRSGVYDGHLNTSSATRLVSLLMYATGMLPTESYEAEMGRAGTPSAIITDLTAALGTAIDELTRPIDAIKHQAKTVTVGISRNEDTLLHAPLVAETLAAGTSLDSLGYRTLRTLAALSVTAQQVVGYTRYRIEVPPEANGLQSATVLVTGRGGIAANMTSRTATDSALRGTKHRVAERREVTAFRGLRDGRTGIMIPEVKDTQTVGITLLHINFVPYLAAPEAKAVLQAYQGRYNALVDAVTETQPGFDDQTLSRVPTIELLTEPVAVLAQHWASHTQ